MDQQINCQKGGGCGGSREEVFIREYRIFSI